VRCEVGVFGGGTWHPGVVWKRPPPQVQGPRRKGFTGAGDGFFHPRKKRSFFPGSQATQIQDTGGGKHRSNPKGGTGGARGKPGYRGNWARFFKVSVARHNSLPGTTPGRFLCFFPSAKTPPHHGGGKKHTRGGLFLVQPIFFVPGCSKHGRWAPARENPPPTAENGMGNWGTTQNPPPPGLPPGLKTQGHPLDGFFFPVSQKFFCFPGFLKKTKKKNTPTPGLGGENRDLQSRGGGGEQVFGPGGFG